MIYEGYYMSSNVGQVEYEEAQTEIQKNDLNMETSKIIQAESGVKTNERFLYKIFKIFF